MRSSNEPSRSPGRPIDRQPLRDVGEATAEWLTGVLRARAVLRRGRATTVRSTRHPTLASIATHLEIAYSKGATRTAPVRLFLKLEAPDERAGPAGGGREVEFYTAVADAAGDLPVVPCYDAAHCAEDGRSHLLLADLSATHGQPAWPLPPFRGQCEQAVECIARLHAVFWEHPRLGRGIGAAPSQARLRDGGRHLEETFRGFADFLGDRLPAAGRALYERVLAALPALWDRRYHDLYDRRRALTLLHGDAHFWSFLYPREPGRDGLRIIDWQAWRPGRGSDDLAYMIALHWYPDRRKALETDLLRRYHEALLRHGVAGYGWDACWTDYRISAAGNLCIPLWQWSVGVPPNVWWPHLERALLAFEDLGCRELLED